MTWSDVLSGDFTRSGWAAPAARPHPARQTRRVLGVAGASCFVSLVWVISAEAETPVPYNVTAALQPPSTPAASTAPALLLSGGATPATSAAPATAAPATTPPPAVTAAPGATTGPAPSSTAPPAATAAPTQTAAPATTAPPDGGGGGDHGGDHGGVITIPPTSNGTFDTSSGGS